MKNLAFTTILCFLLTSLSAQTYTVSSTLSGANEVPPNGSGATGTLTGTYDASTNVITLNVTYANLTTALSAAHLHKGAAGVNGPVIINLNPTTGMTSGNINGNFNVAASDEADLIAGDVYINLHTSTYPGGEIRGQLSLVENPNCQTSIESGDLCINSNTAGIIMQSANGTCYKLQIDDSGNVITTMVNCP